MPHLFFLRGACLLQVATGFIKKKKKKEFCRPSPLMAVLAFSVHFLFTILENDDESVDRLRLCTL